MHIRSLVLFLIVPAAGCYTKPVPPTEPAKTEAATPVAKETTPATPPTLAIDETCPMAVPGTSVSVEDSIDGATLVFTTNGDVTALRSRVISMANDHNSAHIKIGALPRGSQGTYASGGATYPNPTGAGSGSSSSVGEDTGTGATSGTGIASGSSAGSDVVGHNDTDDNGKLPTANQGGTSASGGVYGPTGQAGAYGSPGMILTHSRAQIEPFEGGVRLVYIADPPDVQSLRDEVKLKAEHLKTGRCD